MKMIIKWLGRIYSGGHFVIINRFCCQRNFVQGFIILVTCNDLLRIQWKCYVAVIQVVVKQSPQNFACILTAMLALHGAEMCGDLMTMEWKVDSFKFDLWM